ncbi:MAG: hypothetical protein AAF267_01195 [Deinococcota bacterium]
MNLSPQQPPSSEQAASAGLFPCLPGQVEVVIVEHQGAADVLTTPDTIDLLRPLMHSALTIKELSEVVGKPFAKMHYQVKKLLALELLTASSTILSKGRTRTRYCASAKRFFVPFAMTSANDLKSFLRQHDAQWYDPLLDAHVECLQTRDFNMDKLGISVYLDRENLFKFELTDDPKKAKNLPLCAPEMDMLWDTSFYLSVEDASALQQDIQAVLAKYQAKRSGPRYVVRFAYAPWKG